MSFINSEEVRKEVADLDKLKAWCQNFNFILIENEAIDQLIEVIGIAEDKNKIALIDLLRILMQNEFSAGYIINKHWSTLVEVSIIGYM